MTLIQISLIITLISGFLITTYPVYAMKRGWPVGEILSNESGIIRSLGGLFMLASIVAIFFYFKWTISSAILVGFSFIGFFLTSIFKTYTQIISIIGLFIGIAIGLYYYLS
ncbi:hypothetical protein V1T75_15930 [Tenacibaculum sp. FZY0031]|uniref:hypothetical protein n=1 Tax=Tenacibaculum sp. FZY0031 TaxID=3116648 RepID=UPI002EAEBE27|nr:hypothetical protein [Tenacibaculum sp. FZY0031]